MYLIEPLFTANIFVLFVTSIGEAMPAFSLAMHRHVPSPWFQWWQLNRLQLLLKLNHILGFGPFILSSTKSLLLVAYLCC